MLKEDLFSVAFDQFQRYHRVRELVEAWRPALLAEGARRLQVLDVGGYPGLMVDFLPEDEVWVVDREYCPVPRFVEADALELPFADAKFDLVVSLDVLEHIPEAKRSPFLGELSRVGNGRLIIGAPFDAEEVREAERIIDRLFRDMTGSENPYLAEHLGHGLPERKATVSTLESLGYSCLQYPNGNLHTWAGLMAVRVWLEATEGMGESWRELNAFYNRDLYSYDHAVAPAYRWIILAARAADELKTLPPSMAPGAPADDRESQASSRLLALLARFADRPVPVLERTEAAEAQSSATHAALEARLSRAEWELNAIKSSESYRLARLIARAAGWFRGRF